MCSTGKIQLAIDKNLNPGYSLAFSGLLTFWDKWCLLSPLLTKYQAVRHQTPGHGRAARKPQFPGRVVKNRTGMPEHSSRKGRDKPGEWAEPGINSLK